MSTRVIQGGRRFNGALRVPSDKSITHRALMFAGLAEQPSVIRMPLLGEDCLATMRAMAALGVRYELGDGEIRAYPGAWSTPSEIIDCGNSGTTMRLLAGLVAGLPLQVTLDGDASLRRRPMARVAEPLRCMGARVEGDQAPLKIHGGRLRGIEHDSRSSAQVKSAVLLAGLHAEGETRVTELAPSRDHTERMLRAMGADLRSDNTCLTLFPGALLRGLNLTVPADISSAAFFLVGAAVSPGDTVEFREQSLNPTRTGILDALAQSGVELESQIAPEEGEPTGTLRATGPDRLRPFRIEGALVPRLIDEIPVLAVLATQCDGQSVIRDAAELRVKESDRIETVAEGLRRMGAHVETHPDGMTITGPVRLKGAEIECRLDHRIGMAFAIAGAIAEGETRILDPEAIATSYPSFWADFDEVTGTA